MTPVDRHWSAASREQSPELQCSPTRYRGLFTPPQRKCLRPRSTDDLGPAPDAGWSEVTAFSACRSLDAPAYSEVRLRHASPHRTRSRWSPVRSECTRLIRRWATDRPAQVARRTLGRTHTRLRAVPATIRSPCVTTGRRCPEPGGLQGSSGVFAAASNCVEAPQRDALQVDGPARGRSAW